MSAQKGRPLTPAQRQARQKSTGPRTPMGKKIVSMNAVKHGMYSCLPIETMAVLRENPIEYVKLLTGLINSFHPRNPAEITMLEDIAQLHWQRRRNQMARGARISLAVERLERFLLFLVQAQRQRREWWHHRLASVLGRPLGSPPEVRGRIESRLFIFGAKPGKRTYPPAVQPGATTRGISRNVRRNHGWKSSKIHRGAGTEGR